MQNTSLEMYILILLRATDASPSPSCKLVNILIIIITFAIW